MHISYVPDTSTITTNPILPEKTLATNFTGLQLISMIDDIDVYHGCNWSFLEVGTSGYSGLFFFRTANILCQNLTVESKYHQSCRNENNQIITTVIIFSMIKGNVSYTITCFDETNNVQYRDNISLTVTGNVNINVSRRKHRFLTFI